MTQEALKLAFETHCKTERHHTVAETRYWCNQYKLLAQAAIEALRENAMREVQRLGQEIENEPCDMGEMCLGCSPRRADGSCPDKEPYGLAAHVIGCFRAAEVEGLQEALAETTDERLKDLVERRLMHALYAAQNTTPPQRKPLTDEQREEIAKKWRGRNWTVGDIIDTVEAAHGIKENT